MHTFHHGNVRIHHNGDFSGTVLIKQDDAPEGLNEVEVPFEALRALVAEQVRRERIAALEQASVRDILGVPKARA